MQPCSFTWQRNPQNDNIESTHRRTEHFQSNRTYHHKLQRTKVSGVSPVWSADRMIAQEPRLLPCNESPKTGAWYWLLVPSPTHFGLEFKSVDRATVTVSWCSNCTRCVTVGSSCRGARPPCGKPCVLSNGTPEVSRAVQGGGPWSPIRGGPGAGPLLDV